MGPSPEVRGEPGAGTGIYTTRNGVREEIRIERIDTRMLDIYASWSPQRRMGALASMVRGVRGMIERQVRALNPDWPREDVRAEVTRRFSGRPG